MRISLIEPADTHYYQPGWTLVGGGAYAQGDTARPMAGLVPPGVEWLRTRVGRVDPEARRLLLEGGDSLEYRNLIVCPGLRLAWERIEGLEETLGRNGVTSNYRYDLAPYTWELVRGLRGGKALFTQPAMPIKCAGAPQKAMYLSCDPLAAGGRAAGHRGRVRPGRRGVVRCRRFRSAADGVRAQVFGRAGVQFQPGEGRRRGAQGLVRGEGRRRQHQSGGKDFDLLHVVPPQLPPTFVAASGLGDAAGWCEVDPATLQHVRHGEIFALGDVCGTANAKTAAAARKQIVVVAENLLGLRSGRGLPLRYDGYGGCPLTVERGRVVLAEFGYAGKLLPTFPLEPTAASRFAWLL